MVNLDITAGETLRLAVTSSFGDGFTAAIVVAHLRGPSAQNLDGAVTGSCATITGDSTSWAPGDYAVEVWGTNAAGEKRVIERGVAKIRASLAGVTGATDIRTDAANALTSIRAMLSGDATKGVKSYTINNRTLERYSMAELLQLEKYYASIVAREERRARGYSTLGPRIAVRL